MLSCDHCPEVSFVNRQHLHFHYKSSSDWHPYCSDCDLCFVDEIELEEVGEILCWRYCNSTDKTWKHAADENHTLSRCFYCSRNFISDNELQRHISARHSRYRCDACDEGFETEVGLNRHYRSSFAHPSCQECGRGFYDELILIEVSNLRLLRHYSLTSNDSTSKTPTP